MPAPQCSHGRVVHMQIVANGAHHYLASVQPDAEMQCDAVPAPYVIGVGLHGGLQRQSGIAGAQGVVLMDDWRAKQGHNAVTEHLVDSAFKAVYGGHNPVDGGIEELLSGFGIEVFNELVESLMSANSTVTCLRSPSRVLLAVRISSRPDRVACTKAARDPGDWLMGRRRGVR